MNEPKIFTSTAIFLLVLTLLIAVEGCTAINMQSFYKPELSTQITIQDKSSEQSNPTSPAYFISFADNHIYEFTYQDVFFEISSPLDTNKSTWLGPLIFPIFPIGLIHDVFFTEPSRAVVYIYVHDEKNRYTNEDIANIALLDLDNNTAIIPLIYHSSEGVLHILTYKFLDRRPSRLKLVLKPISNSTVAPSEVILHKVRRPSISAGVW